MPIDKKSMFVHLEEEIKISRMSANEGVFFYEAKFPDRFNPVKNLKSTVEALLRKIQYGTYEEDAWFFAMADGLFLAMQKGMTADQVIDMFKEIQQKREEMMRSGGRKKKDAIEAQLRAQLTSTIFAMQKGQEGDNFALISRVSKGNYQAEMILRRVSQIMEKGELTEILHHMLNEGVTPECVVETFKESGQSLDSFKKVIKDKSSDIYDNEERKKKKKEEQQAGISGTEPGALKLASSVNLQEQQKRLRNRRNMADADMSRQ